MKRSVFIKSSLAGAALVLVQKITRSENTDLIKKMIPKIIRKGEGHVLNVIGDMQTIKLTGEETNGQFTLIEEENVPGTMIPMHTHSNEDEVFRVLEGQMELTVGGKTTVLNPGDIGFGPRGVPHSWRIVGNRKAKVILSVFPAGIESMFEELSQLPAGPPDLTKVAEICGRYGVHFV